MASTTRSGRKYSGLEVDKQQGTASNTGINFKLDLNTESAGIAQCVEPDGQAPEHKEIVSTHLGHYTDDHVDFEYELIEESVQQGPDRDNNLVEAVINYSAEFSESGGEPKRFQGHIDECVTKLNIEEKYSLTPEQVNRIQKNRNMAIERLTKRNAEKMSPETQIQVIDGIIKNQNKSGTCAYSEIVTPDKEFQIMANASQVDNSSFNAVLNLPRGEEQIVLTPTQSIRIERNRQDALRRLRMK